jgi:cytosine/creatinine deaminase
MDITIQHALMDKSFELVNIGIDGGTIVTLTRDPLSPGKMDLDAQGQLVVPPFFEPHFHLDNPFLWGEINQSGTLREAIEIYARVKKDRDLNDLVQRATEALRESLSYGVLWFRTNVDIDPVAQLRLLKGVAAVKEKFASVMDISVIAFPQMGMARQPEIVDLMYAAMENGADIVGGIPHIERDMEDAARQIEIAFEIAKKYNADIDMHVDETDDPYWQSLELLAEKTIQENYQGRVTAGHCCSMAAWDEKTFERILGKVQAARINITTNTLTNLVIQGHGDKPPIRRGIPRLADLINAGVNVACAHDDVKNMFYPFGNMNPLFAANVAAHAGHLTTPKLIRAAFEMPLYHAAQTFGVQDYGIRVGNPANLVLLPVQSDIDALRIQPLPTLVMRQGKILVQTELRRVFAASIPN